MEKLKKFVLAGISMFFGASIQYLYTMSKERQIFFYVVTLVLLILVFVAVLFFQFWSRKKKIKYSILVFILNEKNYLLTIDNKYHKRVMIPCGIIPDGMTPNEMVKKTIAELYDQDLLSSGIQNHLNDEIICFNSQIEFITKHEKKVKEHYAFIYVGYSRSELFASNKSICFRSKDELLAMDRKKGLYEDLLQRYMYYIDKLGD